MSAFSKLVAVVVWIALSLSASAQERTPEQQEHQKSFRAGFDALKAGRLDEGIAAFQRCLEIIPEDSASAYNIACGYSLKGEVEEAFTWLDKAVELGFGITEETFELAKTDVDTVKLRSDPRFAEFIAKLTTKRKELEETNKKLGEYYGKPAVYVPSALEGKAEVPLLVVLHDVGKTKESVIAGHWKAVADELGMALLAPSGKYPTAGEPENGMSWIDSPELYLQKSWTYEKTAQDAVTAFKKERKVDGSRVVVAGEGQGGMLACSIGIGSPGLYKAVLAVNAAMPLQVVESKGANAGKMGLKVRLLLEQNTPWFPADQDLGLFAEGLRQRLATWSVGGEVNTFARSEPDAFTALLVENVRALLPAAQPVEAGAK